MRTFVVLLSFVASTLAYFVTFPSSSAGWKSKGAQNLNWDRVNTDPTNFALVLDNQKISGFQRKYVAQLVDGTTGSTILYPENGEWPTGKHFRINLVRDSQSPDSILAQSEEFEIVPA